MLVEPMTDVWRDLTVDEVGGQEATLSPRHVGVAG